MNRFDQSPDFGNPEYTLGQLLNDIDLSQWTIRVKNLGGFVLYRELVRSTRLRGDPDLLERIKHQPLLLKDENIQGEVALQFGELEISLRSILADINHWPVNSGFIIRTADQASETLARLVYRAEGSSLMQMEETLPSLGVKVPINSSSRVDQAARVQFAYDDPDLATMQGRLAVWAEEWDPEGTFCALLFDCYAYRDYPALARDLPASRHPVALDSEEDWSKAFAGFNLFLDRYEAALQGQGNEDEQHEALALKGYLEDTGDESDRVTVRTQLFPTVGAYDPSKWEVKKLG